MRLNIDEKPFAALWLSFIIEKKEHLSNLKKEELSLTSKIADLDHKNSLLSTNLDLDYIETLIRKRFLFGKEGETIYIIKKDEN